MSTSHTTPPTPTPTHPDTLHVTICKPCGPGLYMRHTKTWQRTPLGHTQEATIIVKQQQRVIHSYD